jgi:cephalosporin-C deacetylase-like acetyl esterase
MKFRNLSVVLVATCFILPALWLAAQSGSPRDQMIAYLNGVAKTQLEDRSRVVAGVRSRADADRRKSEVREKILRLIGGLPEGKGPVSVREFRKSNADGFRVERIAYESQPGFWVTADVYVPEDGAGPFPAIVLAPGHGAGGKSENWNWGGNFARNGIMALAYDPIGQGERLQYYDADQQKSKVGNPTGEHGEANIGPMLIGDNIARYMVNDAMRGVDYLISRKDVDATRIGAFGCSGGGTSTAYFAALDDRVKVAASACYITSFNELLASPTGAQDAEQSIPHFIEQGLDFADWVEAFAPKPYAVISTMDDMFPFEGARQTVDEVKRFYATYSAEDKVHWITGPGGHGNLGPVSPAIMKFFTLNLKGTTDEPSFSTLRAPTTTATVVTNSGQVSTEFREPASVFSLNRTRAESRMAKQTEWTSKGDVPQLQARLRADIRSLTGAVVEPGAVTQVNTTSTEQRTGYRLESVAMTSDNNMQIAGYVAIPNLINSVMPAILIMDTRPGSSFVNSGASGGDVDRLAKAGRIVMVVDARPTPPGTESIKSPYLGPFNLLSLRSFLVGKSIIGLRIDDAIRAVNWLAARRDVDRNAITVYGSGPLGMVALHAAVVDSRISRVVVANSLTSYRMILEQPLHRNVSEIVIPGVLQHYDTTDLLTAIFPRPVIYVSPQDALGDAVRAANFRTAISAALKSDQNMGSSNRIQFQTAAPGDPLPLE